MVVLSDACSKVFRRESRALNRTRTSSQGIPTPFPTVGKPSRLIFARQRKGFLAIRSLHSTPDFGRFYGSRGGSCLVWMPRSPKTSLVAHATNEFPPRTGYGRVKDTCPLERMH